VTLSAQAALAEFVAGYAASDVPAAARDAARASLLDTIAVALAGHAEPVNARVAEYAGSVRQADGAIAWLSGQSRHPEEAALLNAVAAHALDYDDVTPAWRGHPGAVLWPAICAGARGPDTPLDAFLEAFVLGFEVGAQLGACIVRTHYPAGWHATATVGVIAAAAACSRLRRLDPSQVSSAIGLAAAQSAGMQANFGSMAKPLQAGFAASAAVRATALAAAGVESADVLEGASGFGSLYAGRGELPVALPRAGAELAIVTQGIEVKQFPNCYAAHRAVEAALAVRRELKDSAGDIVAIEIEGTPTAHKALLPHLPTSVDEARFSVEFGVACALVDGAVRLSSFTRENLQRADLRKLMGMATTSETAVIGPRRTARVTVEMQDGRRIRQSAADLPGRFGEPDFMPRLRDKVSDCLREGGRPQGLASLWETAFAPGAPHPGAWEIFER
jgi:2-methylcitrate dehydratase PrpD